MSQWLLRILIQKLIDDHRRVLAIHRFRYFHQPISILLNWAVELGTAETGHHIYSYFSWCFGARCRGTRRKGASNSYRIPQDGRRSGPFAICDAICTAWFSSSLVRLLLASSSTAQATCAKRQTCVFYLFPWTLAPTSRPRLVTS